MALSPTGYVTTTGGSSGSTGSYVPVVGANASWNGATQYTNGTDFLCYYNQGWGVFSAANQNSTPAYLNAGNGSSTSNMPLTGWTSGIAPVPTFAPINPMVYVSGALVVCSATGTIAPSSGAWQVLNAAGTVLDSNGSSGRAGNNGLFYVECPSSTGGTFKVQALAGAAIGANYSARCQTAGGTSSGPFDVVASNPQVPINNAAYISCPGVGTTAVASGAWEVRNAIGTVVDTGASPGSNGANNLFNVGPPSATGGPVNVKALTGAIAGAGYNFRSTYTSGSSTGPFDVVPALPPPRNLTAMIVF